MQKNFISVPEDTLQEIFKWAAYLNDESIKNMTISEKVKAKINNLAYACNIMKDFLKPDIEIIKPNLIFTKEPGVRTRTDFIVLHHSVSETDDIYDIHRMHIKRDYVGIGYHFFINLEGQIFQGRNIKAIGAHCQGINDRSIGICCQGNYEQRAFMPQAQKKTLTELIKHIRHFEDFQNVKIVGHKEYYATLCPGKHFPLKEFKGM